MPNPFARLRAQLLRYHPFTSIFPLRPSYEHFYNPSGQWLYHDAAQRAARYTPFNVEELRKIASNSVDAGQCTQISKLAEGSYNKIFLLTFDNDMQAIARIPSSLVGNVELTTRSEVATMQFLREHVGTMAAPKVLAWDPHPSNPVASAYIIMEYIGGISDSEYWLEMTSAQYARVIASLFLLQAKLVVPFSQIGSLYLFEDVSPELQARPLFKDDELNKNAIAQKYRIGPIVSRDWWRRGRMNVPGDRGPWPDMPSYIIAAARLELECLERGIDVDNPNVRSKVADISGIRRLLEMSIAIAPSLVPAESSVLAPVLAHPDLNIFNMIIQSEPPHPVKSFIDWQGAIIAPIFLQASLPTAVYAMGENNLFQTDDHSIIPPLPDDIGNFTPEEQGVMRRHYRLIQFQRVYEMEMETYLPEFALSMAYNHQHHTRRLLKSILRCWADGPLLLQHHLIELTDFFPEGSCPIQFPDAERAFHRDQFEGFQTYIDAVEWLCHQTKVDPEGRVHRDDEKGAMTLLQDSKMRWHTKQMNGPYPFHGDAWSYHLV
ncbi:kinase-like domain-containing protein [Desarmillaria tabescens]|uniref:Altered inheritance of mitochondria protein 9, mitochondrial n=1 Tax=Armillaria tabescens TaxID=1929756 RepID=A0AA39JD09_ARMTA|nr:kinase-like domain-containing protein [Desarmillaria tabescens]KAK0439089.1 kinase-like domain-containing protein [Desarmillaria tabescens]